MVAFVKYNAFVDEVSKGGHNLTTAVFKCALTNTAPTPLTDTAWSTGTYPDPASANGYTSGGNTLTTSSTSTVTYVFKAIIADTVFTASGGSIGPFRYVIIYNSSASNKLVGYYDYASALTLNNGETFTTDFDGTNGMIQITMTP